MSILNYQKGNSNKDEETSSSKITDTFNYATIEGAKHVLEQMREKYLSSIPKLSSKLEKITDKKSDPTKLQSQ